MNKILSLLISVALVTTVAFTSVCATGCATTQKFAQDVGQKIMDFSKQSAISLRDELNTKDGQDNIEGILAYAGGIGINFSGLSPESKIEIGNALWAWGTMWTSLADGKLTTERFNAASAVFAPSINSDKYRFLFQPLNGIIKNAIVKLENAASKEKDPVEAAKWASAAVNFTVVAARASQDLASVLVPAKP